MIRGFSLALLVALLSGCSGVRVGGSQSWDSKGGMSADHHCSGACLSTNSDGHCIVFARGISEACRDYFKATKP